MTYLAQVSFQRVSMLPEDVVVNTFHFDIPAPLPGDFDDINGTLGNFYTATPPLGIAALRTYMSNELSGVAEVRLYDLTLPTPRVPVYEEPLLGWIAPTSNPLPAEVALVLSFQGTPASGTNQARRRNRIYLGPLATNALESAPANGQPENAFVTSAAAAMHELKADSTAAGGWEWVGYSPTDGVSFSITNGWVDNAFDTQRRRGEAATARTLWDTSGVT